MRQVNAPLTGFEVNAPQNTRGARPILLTLQDVGKFKLEGVHLFVGSVSRCALRVRGTYLFFVAGDAQLDDGEHILHYRLAQLCVRDIR